MKFVDPAKPNRAVHGALLMVLSILLLMFGTHAFAQSGIPDINQMTTFTPPTDESIKMWKSLLGDFATNPFSTLGGPTTLLGGLFIIFNGCIFVVGFSWAMYGIVSGVIATAHEGEVLGKRMSTIWFPIRMVTGIAGMIPIFGGFTLNQAIMMWLTTIGIGIGNALWMGAIDNTSAFTAMMNQQEYSPVAAKQMDAMALNMFASNVCMISEAAAAKEVTDATGGAVPTENLSISSSATAFYGNEKQSYSYGSNVNEARCGIASVESKARSASNLGASFRVASVDYAKVQAVAASADGAQLKAMEAMQTQIGPLALQWLNDRAAHNAAGDGTMVPPPLDILYAISGQEQKNAVASMSGSLSGQTGAITESAMANMKALGWFGAGAWYSTFAEANAAFADAVKGPELTSRSFLDGQTMYGLSSGTQDAINAFKTALKTEKEKRGELAGGAGDGTKALLDSAIKENCDALGGFGSSVMGTATGNCSMGEGIVSAAIRASAIGSGGGGNSKGFMDSQGLVNPVVMMKNMGDYVMSVSSSVLLAGWVGQAALWVADKIPGAGGLATKIASKVVSNTSGGDGSIFAVVKTLAVLTLVLGALMSIYIPMVPFITWMGAIIAYAASVFEGLAGATLHAMAHLDGDGEGMGQRTGHGYLFMVNVLARPALMVIGFFVASAIMIAIGTLQAHLFLPAMANVQGNSITGLCSIAMFLIIFFVMNVTLISASMNLIYVITDQVLGFVGGAINSHLGRDTEDKVHNMFMMAARFGPGSIQGSAAAKAGAKSAHAAALAAKAKETGGGG